MQALTPKQEKVYNFIATEIQAGTAPTYAEIAEEMEVRVNCVYEHVQKLVDKGYITAQPGRARSFKLTPQPE